MRFVNPQVEEHRAFQDESVAVFRFADAVEQPFQSISGQQKSEFLVPHSRQVQQTLARRRRDVRHGFAHCRDSM